MFVHSVKPPKNYSTIEIAEAMRKVAKEKNRPDYDMVVCHSVRKAIQEGESNQLVDDVLKYLSNNPKLHLVSTKTEDHADFRTSYSPDKIEKIDFLREWASKRRGRLVALVRHTRDSSNRMASKLRYHTYYEDEMLNAAYEKAQEIIRSETVDVDNRLGDRQCENFFVDLLQIYSTALINDAYRKIVSGIKPHRVNWDSIASLWIPVGNIEGWHKPTLIQLLKTLSERKVIELHYDPETPEKPFFRVGNLVHCKKLYRIAIESVDRASQNAGFKLTMTKFTRSKIAAPILPELLQYAYKEYGVVAYRVAA